MLQKTQADKKRTGPLKKGKKRPIYELYNMFENSEKDLNDTTKKPIEEKGKTYKLNLQYKPCEERAQLLKNF